MCCKNVSHTRAYALILFESPEIHASTVIMSSSRAPIICKDLYLVSVFTYNWGMQTLDQYLDDHLSRGRSYFSKEEALKAAGFAAKAFTAAATRLIKKHRLLIPWRGFYLILRPEDRIAGAPDPAR